MADKLTLQQLAAKLGVSEQLVSNLLDQGVIQSSDDGTFSDEMVSRATSHFQASQGDNQVLADMPFDEGESGTIVGSNSKIEPAEEVPLESASYFDCHRDATGSD